MTATPQLNKYLSQTLPDIKTKSFEAVIAMHGEGATVPFMARYRKEKTGNLDEVQIRDILDAFEKFNEIVKRKAFLIKEIDGQGNLTSELQKRIEASMDLGELDEIYRPFKRKKKTKATIAREAGLEPLADWLWGLGHGEVKDSTTIEVKAKEFINAAQKIVTYELALKGAQDIIVEKTANDPGLRELVRKNFFEKGQVVCKATKNYKPNSKYEMYADFTETVKSIQEKKASHRYLALRRGWQESELTVAIKGDDEELLESYKKFVCTEQNQATQFLHDSAKLALTTHVHPSISNEVHRFLKDKADKDAIYVFAENVRKLLLASPYGAKCVLGVDPGLKTGCKIALVDKSGQFISHTVMQILGDKAEENAKVLFTEVLKQIRIESVAVGNGTAGRETETFIRKILKELNENIPVIMVNESGASVYSASEVARGEFPDLDLTVRGAISIARRLQDPLAELVKIDPKSIGVGQYQHDVSQTMLKKELHYVVEDCVNQVGVDLNTASESLLSYVAGVGPALAKNIVEYRQKNGLFEERDQLLKVSRFSSKSYEQAAGFLRIRGGRIALDGTGIHPERYSAVKDMAAEVGVNVSQLIGEGAKQILPLKEKWADLVGEYTFDDIAKELEKPGRDPRDPFKVFAFREDIHEVKDLEKDMLCPGIVTNVTNFGAFVDIGVHQDGLVHISELTHKFVDDPRKVVNPGDQVKVKILAVDKEKNQISLTMKLTEAPKTPVKAKDNAKGKGPRKATGKPSNRKDGKGGKMKKKAGGGKPQQRRPERKPFNNSFGALADLKNQLKKG